MSQVSIRFIRCPKCQRPAAHLVETSEAHTDFTVRQTPDGDHLVRDAEGWHCHGRFIRLEAECRKGHRWRIRGARQVWNVDINPGVED